MKIKNHFLRSLGLAATFALTLTAAQATDYPITVTDVSGRSVEIEAEPQRVVVQDGRDLFALALLDREDPFKRMVAWNNILIRSDPQTWAALQRAWPESSAKPIDMKFGDEGQVNLEQLAVSKPDLLIFQVRVRQALEDADLFNRLESLGIPVILVDTEMEPVVNVPKTVQLIGTVFNREKEAKQFTDFYASHLAAINSAIAGQPKPSVFLEAKAGQKGIDSCCFTHGDVYWGKLATAAGGVNLGSELVKGRTGDVTLETVIAKAPDVFIMTGSPFSNDGSVSPPFGINSDPKKIETALSVLEQRKGFEHIKAVKDGRVFGLYHQLYASAWNIYAVEYMAKAFYPEQLKSLDPDANLHTLISQFTGLPADLPVTFGAKAPTVN